MTVEVPPTRDPDDDYLVALLRTSKADVLVTGGPGSAGPGVADVEVPAPRKFVALLDAGEVVS